MDEIQNCIQDAQYGMALKVKSAANPVRLLARPPKDTDWEAFTQKHELRTGKKLLQSPIGRHYLGKFLDTKTPSLKCYPDFITDLIKFKNGFTTKENAEKCIAEHREALVKAGLDSQVGASDKYRKKLHDDAYSSIRHSFEKLKSAIYNAVEDNLGEEFRQCGDLYQSFLDDFWASKVPVTMKDFQLYRDLGRGAFGAVSGCMLCDTGQMFACKMMNRKQVKGKKAFKLTMTEKRALHRLGNNPTPFCIHLRYSFYDEDNLYFILPLLAGGDLLFHLKDEGVFCPARAQFIAAEVALGLDHIHKLRMIYRDLKPENVLMNEQGHAVISDMGLVAELRKDRTTHKGRAGTPGYWCPEMINKEEYDHGADWFSFGCFLYELICGVCPFSPKCYRRYGFVPEKSGKEGRNDAILNWEVQFNDKYFDENMKNIIQEFLNKDRHHRLGATEEGFDAIKKHKYFETWYEYDPIANPKLDKAAKRNSISGKLKRWEEGGKRVIWEKILPDTIDAPWIPMKDKINAAHQDDIEERNNEMDYRKLKLGPEDVPKDSFHYAARERHENDILRCIIMRDNGELDNLQTRDDGADGACCSLV